MKHIHHIVPKHMGGTDDPSNLVELSVEEHAEAHKKLYEEYGNEYDRIAYEALSGIIKKEEVIQKVLTESGKKGGEKSKELGVGIHSLNQTQKSEFGRLGAIKTVNLGIGIHSLTKEQRSILQTGKNNSFYGKTHSDETKESMSESRKGNKNSFYGKTHSDETKKIIGQKNSEKLKGKLWWNDGKNHKRSVECPGDGWISGRLKR